jgi:hypothetical protein
MSFVRNVFGGLLGRQAVEDAAEHPAAPPPPPPHKPLHVVFECANAVMLPDAPSCLCQQQQHLQCMSTSCSRRAVR